MSSSRRPAPKRQARSQQGKQAAQGKSAADKGKGQQKKGQPHRKRVEPIAAPQPRTGTFRLGFVAGATPGKWISIWRERYPLIALELVTLENANARAAVIAGEVDIAILREPFSHADLNVIALYEETVGIVVSVDSALEAAESVTTEDLAGEVVIVPLDDVLNLDPIDGTIPAAFAPPATTEDAIATVATGVGFVAVPMSVARLHHRKDVVFRPLIGAPVAPVALAWQHDSIDTQNFVGVVRGRTAQSSRG